MIKWNPDRLFEVPAHLVPGLKRYVEDGIRPGDALMAILTDAPLSQCLAHADPDTRRCLGDIYRFLYNNVGSPAWGSAERVQAWIERGGIQGEAK